MKKLLLLLTFLIATLHSIGQSENLCADLVESLGVLSDGVFSGVEYASNKELIEFSKDRKTAIALKFFKPADEGTTLIAVGVTSSKYKCIKEDTKVVFTFYKANIDNKKLMADFEDYNVYNKYFKDHVESGLAEFKKESHLTPVSKANCHGMVVSSISEYSLRRFNPEYGFIKIKVHFKNGTIEELLPLEQLLELRKVVACLRK